MSFFQKLFAGKGSPKSRYRELQDEEAQLAKAAKAVFDNALDAQGSPRAGSTAAIAKIPGRARAFAATVDSALAAGEITEQQKRMLIDLLTKHSIPSLND
jgi:hypothetical protein